MRYLIAAIIFSFIVTDVIVAQETPPAPDAAGIYSTLTSGQITRFDYAANTSDVHIANLLTALLASIWSMFFFALFVVFVRGLKA